MSTYPYQSGWCTTGDHTWCAGTYSGTTCACPCHTPEPAQPALFDIPTTPDRKTR